MPTKDQRETYGLTAAVRFFYDLQKLRIQTGNRAGKKKKKSKKDAEKEAKKKAKKRKAPPKPILDPVDQAFLDRTSDRLEGIEKDALDQVKRHLKPVKIWNAWLKDVKGIGPTLGGLIVAEFDIERATTPSKFWAYAGLAVDPETGRATRLTRGQKAKYNPWIKSKMLEVLGGCLIKAKSEPYYNIYVNRKHRRENQRVDVCMGCGGKGRRQREVTEEDVPTIAPTAKTPKEVVGCWNCGGTGGPAPWGADKQHRARDAQRYMAKMFLLDLWREWRTVEGLEVRPSYHEEKLGHVHSRSA